jgi:hypothetical protein
VTPLERVLTKLPSATGPNISGWYDALCPTHDDRRRSLGIKAGDTGAVIVKCQAACTTERIVEALGLTMKDLFPAANSHGARMAAVYDYCDEASALLYQVVRFEPKDFRQRRPDGNGGWTWKLNGVRRVLFHLPQLLAADPAMPVYVVEGEKDVLALEPLGLVATTNAGGAGKWRREYADVLRGRRVVILPDNDDAGRQHAEHVAAAIAGMAVSVRVLELPGLPPKGDVSDWIAAGGTRSQLEALGGAAPAAATTGDDARPGVWSRAVPASEFLASDDPALDFLVPRILAPGSLTHFFSPRGLGKTHVAYAHAVALARAGHRVLLLDRDNSRQEIRRRLRAWGAAELTMLDVMTRDDVPPLTDTAAWRLFPFGCYRLVIVDSFDASTEGVGEQDSARPAQAIAPLLDIAHRANGPAILVLGNTIKSGSHGRGSGVVEDRGDIVYEVRDATDFRPSGTKPWWTELPASGRDAWAERATRRRQRDRYVLAFVPSKFRVGIEPDPFALEINLSEEPWQLRDVTAEIDRDGEAARTAAAAERTRAEQEQVTALLAEIDRRREAQELPPALSDVIELLKRAGAGRNRARDLLDEQAEHTVRLVRDDSRKGRPTFVVRAGDPDWWREREKSADVGTRASRDTGAGDFPRTCAARPGEIDDSETVEPQGVPDSSISPVLASDSRGHSGKNGPEATGPGGPTADVDGDEEWLP